MKRYNQDFADMELADDGEWIRYEDHVEAMKRIAGAPVAQGLTDEQIEAIWQTTPTDGIHYIYGEPAKELRIRFARAILAQAAPSASAQQAEPQRNPLSEAAAAANCTYPHCTTAVGCQGTCKTYLAAPAPSAQQAEPVANNEAYDLAYDKIDRFLRSNLDDDDYAEFSRALDSLFAAPAPASPADQSDTERLSWLAEAKAELRLTVRDDYMLCIGNRAIRTGKTPRDAIDAAMSATPPAAEE